jgi:hypothetical protein
MRGDEMDWRARYLLIAMAAVAVPGCRSAPYQGYDLPPPVDLKQPDDPMCGPEGQACVPGTDASAGSLMHE